MLDVLVFTPVYRLEPETVEAIFAMEWDGPLSYLFQRDNPLGEDDEEDERVRGVLNHLHQYQRGREVFLSGQYDAMLIVESDIIPPADTIKRLAALDADVAYGVYMFRVHDHTSRAQPVVNLTEFYYERARNRGESWSTRGLWPPRQDGPARVTGAGFGCTLVKRHVLEAIGLRTLSPAMRPRIHCDTWFSEDAYKAGYSMWTDTRVRCGHKTPEGVTLWPPS